MEGQQIKPRVFALSTDWGRPGCNLKYGGVGWYRIINPFEKIGADVHKEGEFRLEIGLAGAQGAEKMKKRGDIWVTKMMDGEDVVQHLLADKEFVGAKLVLDLDDDPFNIDPNHPNYQHFIDRKGLYEYFIHEADHIIVATEEIKKVIKHLNSKITVIPNAIDPEIWKVKRKERKDGKVRIGWFGSASHLVDTPILMEFMDEILAKYPQVEFHLAGMTGKDNQEGRIFNHAGTKGYQEYPQWVADRDLDIAIAPLKDTQFNRCKSNIKWLEHSMLKTPMVLSDVSNYSAVKNYKTGFLAKNKNQWIKYLGWLIENEDKRKEIGEAAYNEVMKNWTIDKQLPKYEAVMERVNPKNITVYTAISNDFDKLIDPKWKGAEAVAFTNQPSEVWETRKPYDKFKDERRNSRIQKLMPHLFFQTEYSIYLDGNIELLVEPQILIDEFLKDKDVAVFRHIGRDCIYAEADAIVGYKKETPQELAPQIKEYARRGTPYHGGLAECGVIIRRHTKEVEQMNEKWWAEYCRFGVRDQMSFPIAFPKENVRFIESSVWRHPYFKFYAHQK